MPFIVEEKSHRLLYYKTERQLQQDRTDALVFGIAIGFCLALTVCTLIVGVWGVRADTSPRVSEVRR